METPSETPGAPRRRPAAKKTAAGKKAPAPKGKGKKKKKRRRSPFMRLMRGLMLTLSIVAAVALFCTAYAGNISPLKHGGFWGILPLCFPLVMLCAAILLVLQIWWHWRGVVIVAIGFIICTGPALQVCPLNIGGNRKAPEGSDTFTLLTYNVHNFSEIRRDSTDTAPNHMLEYVLASDADIVCMQEVFTLSVYRKGFITSEQVQSLHDRYPYIIKSAGAQAILSKYPVQPIHLSLTKEEFDDAELAAYRISFPNGKIATLFNVHLQSLNLSEDDRELYKNLTRLQRENLGAVREQLIDKLSYANVERARQTQALMRLIRHYGGPDVLICGDFNDVATCYALRTLEEAGFSSVYADLGFGPIITYNSGRFYFGIDHVLFRGDFTPLSIKKGTTRASDHYPLTVTLALD